MKKNKSKYPFANEVKEMKNTFKKMIDAMPDEDFIDFISYIDACLELCEDDEDEFWDGKDFEDDEDWDDDILPF